MNFFPVYVTRICEIYIDDLLVHGRTDDELLDNLRKILVRFRENRVTANPDNIGCSRVCFPFVLGTVDKADHGCTGKKFIQSGLKKTVVLKVF